MFLVCRWEGAEIIKKGTWKMSLIYSASEAGFPPFFYSHNAKALLRGVAFDIQIKFQNYKI